jgi:hypothetical protein
MDHWLAVLYTAMKIEVKKKTENSLLDETVLAVKKKKQSAGHILKKKHPSE